MVLSTAKIAVHPKYINEDGAWWSDTEFWKPKYLEKTLFHCQCIHHKPHMDLDWAGNACGPPQ